MLFNPFFNVYLDRARVSRRTVVHLYVLVTGLCIAIPTLSDRLEQKVSLTGTLGDTTAPGQSRLRHMIEGSDLDVRFKFVAPTAITHGSQIRVQLERSSHAQLFRALSMTMEDGRTGVVRLPDLITRLFAAPINTIPDSLAARMDHGDIVATTLQESEIVLEPWPSEVARGRVSLGVIPNFDYSLSCTGRVKHFEVKEDVDSNVIQLSITAGRHMAAKPNDAIEPLLGEVLLPSVPTCSVLPSETRNWPDRAAHKTVLNWIQYSVKRPDLGEGPPDADSWPFGLLLIDGGATISIAPMSPIAPMGYRIWHSSASLRGGDPPHLRTQNVGYLRLQDVVGQLTVGSTKHTLTGDEVKFRGRLTFDSEVTRDSSTIISVRSRNKLSDVQVNSEPMVPYRIASLQEAWGSAFLGAVFLALFSYISWVGTQLLRDLRSHGREDEASAAGT